MRIVLLILFVSIQCQAALNIHVCESTLIKAQNQFYHIKTGKFLWIRILHQKLKHVPTTRTWAPLHSLHMVHPIDYPIAAMKKRLRAREEILNLFHDELIELGVSIDVQSDFLPSSGAMCVLKDGDEYFVKDGNSRLEALNHAFQNTNPMIELEQYNTDDPSVLYLMHKVRHASGLE